MLDIRAYGDESESPTHEVLTCAFAPFDTWQTFGDEWSRLLAGKTGITEFHAHDCAQGANEFKDLDNEYRQQLYREFAEVIQKHRLHAAAIVVEMAAMPTIAAAFGPPFDKPWVFAFSQLIPMVMRRCPPGERVAFLFDEKKEHEARAFEGFAALKQYQGGSILPNFDGSQLSRIAFGGSAEYLPLQAADLFAYEVRLRMRIERPVRASWIHTTANMASVTVAFIEQNAANRFAALKAFLDQRGLTIAQLTKEDLAGIVQSLPPLPPSPISTTDVLGSYTTNSADLPPVEWE